MSEPSVWPKCRCGGIAVDNASGGITRTCIRCGAIVNPLSAEELQRISDEKDCDRICGPHYKTIGPDGKRLLHDSNCPIQQKLWKKPPMRQRVPTI